MTQDIHRHRLLILVFGSQYTQLIARRVREVGVYCEIVPWDTSDDVIRDFAPKVLSSLAGRVVTDPDSPAPRPCFRLTCPCSAFVTACRRWPRSWAVRWRVDTSEFGYAQIRRTAGGGLLADIADQTDAEGRQLLDVWMSLVTRSRYYRLLRADGRDRQLPHCGHGAPRQALVRYSVSP